MGSYLLRSGRDDSLLLGDLQLHIGGMVAPLDTAAGMYYELLSNKDNFGLSCEMTLKFQLECCSKECHTMPSHARFPKSHKLVVLTRSTPGRHEETKVVQAQK